MARLAPGGGRRTPRWVEGGEDVAELVARVVDRARSEPLVCLTAQPYLSRPMLDPEAVLEAIEQRGDVWVVARAADAWSLTEALPPGLDVYGGAARVWWPIADLERVNPGDHPVFTIFSPGDGERVTGEIGTHVWRRMHPPPQPGEETVGVVTAALEHGAEIRLAGGHAAFAANDYLANGPIFRAWEAVQPEQAVRVRVSGSPRPGRDAVPVTLKPFAPDPWRRLAEVYRPGMVVEGVVVGLRDHGALVELLPGARGWLPSFRIARSAVEHPGDHLYEEERVVVRLRTLNPDACKAEVSLVDVAPGTEPEPPASIYPDGPPWLSPDEPEPEPEPEQPAEAEPEPEQAAEPGPEIAPQPPAELDPEPPAEVDPEPVADAGPEREPDAGSETPTEVEPEPAVEPEAASERLGDEVAALAELVATGAAVESRAAAATEEAERELARLRGEARRLTSELREEIAAAELRVQRLARDETAELLGDAQREVAELREQVDALRGQLTTAERDREQLIKRQRAASGRADQATRQAAKALEKADGAAAAAKLLRDQLDVIDGRDPARRFVRELHFTWTRKYTSDDDRRRWPFREPKLGPQFLAALDRLEGVSRERVLEVCTHVATGRAAEMPGLQLHQLRAGDNADASPRVREDGATAWRVSLQVNAPSARRLHFWQRHDGVELSTVGTHDDYGIV